MQVNAEMLDNVFISNGKQVCLVTYNMLFGVGSLNFHSLFKTLWCKEKKILSQQ